MLACHAARDTGYFESLIRACFLVEDNIAILHTLPMVGLGEKDNQAERARLAEAKASWTADEVEALVRQNAELVRWQESEDTPRQLATLPQLRLSDLAGQPEDLSVTAGKAGGAHRLLHTTASKGISHLTLYFSTADLPLEDYPKAALLASLLGKLSTGQRKVADLQNSIKTHIGKLDFTISAFSEAFSGDRQCKPFFVVRCSLLDEELDQGLPIIHDILMETKFQDTPRIKDILLQQVESMRTGIIQAGHMYGMHRCKAHLRSEYAVNEGTKGYTCYNALKEMARTYSDECGAFALWAKEFCAKHFCAGNLTISTAGAVTDRQISDFTGNFPQGEKQFNDTARYSVSFPRHEGIAIPSGVSYASMGVDILESGGRYCGAWAALANILSYDYLWNEVRVKGGAYGVGFSTQPSGIATYYSYRDPNGIESLAHYRKTADFVRAFCASKPDLQRFIVGAIGASEPLLSARARMDLADRRYFEGLSHQRLTALRNELIGTTTEDLETLGLVLEKAAGQDHTCIVGPGEMFSATGEAQIPILQL